MSDTENTQPPEIPADLSALSAAQLEDLVSDYPEDDPLRAVLAEVLAQRRKTEASAAKKTSGGQPTPKGQATTAPTRTSKGRKLRAGEPGDRAMAAAETFNNEPAKVAVWRDALAEATDPTTGEIVLTGRIVQLGINAYFAQRKIDDAVRKAAAQQVTAAVTAQAPDEDVVEEQPTPTTAGPGEELAAEGAEKPAEEAPFVSVTELPGLTMLSTPEGAALLTDLSPEMLSGLFSEDDSEVWDD